MTKFSKYLLAVLCVTSSIQIEVQARKEKPHFVHISLDPFTGEGTTPIPIDSDSFIDPGATVVLLERDLAGTATYYYGDSKEHTKEALIVAQITGSCTIVAQDIIGPIEVVYTSHCTVCVSYQDICAAFDSGRELWGRESKCSHAARGTITATGDILSRYLLDGAPPLGVSLVDSEARLIITGGTHDLNSANSGIYDMYHDGRWNMIMKVPLNAKSACKLHEYEFD